MKLGDRKNLPSLRNEPVSSWFKGARATTAMPFWPGLVGTKVHYLLTQHKIFSGNVFFDKILKNFTGRKVANLQ